MCLFWEDPLPGVACPTCPASGLPPAPAHQQPCLPSAKSLSGPLESALFFKLDFFLCFRFVIIIIIICHSKKNQKFIASCQHEG